MASLSHMRSLFTEHPSSVDESYRQHFGVAFGFSRRLAAASGAALLHAVCPALCTTTASDRVKEMCDEMMSRHSQADCDDLEAELAELTNEVSVSATAR